ncbi:large ribosomal subunit protein mL38 [Phlebotomus argentipes]|uniref:large ribosomal subunit protein mL38 n=1 Tax=Phlebotomus argentipes TaxID=94469 RepID=UPI0028932EDE|nr:large ribosomal subunit protein mL38 [Phlebotomus argentipes]
MLGNLLYRSFIARESHKIVQIPIRHGHTIRGKRPGVARSLQQRLDEMNYVDPELARKINIGLPQLKASRSDQLSERLQHRKMMKNNPEIEKLARHNELEVDLENVSQEWMKTSGPFDVRGIADYYEIFDHLFGDAYFIPRVHLRVLYPTSTDDCNPVYYGNILSPEDAVEQPIVEFDHQFRLPKEKDKENLWTLIMTTPDGHLSDSSSEYVHWLVTNIPNGDVAKGDLIVPYLQPFPVKGLGYQRYVFVLYKQNNKLDLKDYKRPQETKNPDERTFKTLDFYRKLQDTITPAGLAFFQAEYDDSVREVFHKKFDSSLPVFEYVQQAPYLGPQKWFPLKRAFNTYMDLYRDPMQINKEFLERKLSKTHPFDGPKPPLRFPMAHSIKNKPSWLRVEIRKHLKGMGRSGTPDW